MLDYVLVNQRFKTSILDTRVYCRTHFQSDHRLVISKVRLKLKAKRRRVQMEPRYQVDPRCLEDQQVEEFRKVLGGEFEAEPKGDVEDDWCTFTGSLKKAQCCLPVAPEKEEGDWVTDEVREVSRKKQEAWMRCLKSPGNDSLKQEYQKWRVQSRKCADKAREEWWEAKAEEAEKLHEAAVRLGRGGSLLKDLKLLCSRQKLKASTPLLSQDGTQLNSTVDKIERWREHFAQVSNVSVELVESVVSTVVEVPPYPIQNATLTIRMITSPVCQMRKG